ncbi:hypothetical protein FACS189492_0240 [Clostridia bacterium]|nr:hypothetical protein FACS189492_0240 [Clostridia bacterium]
MTVKKLIPQFISVVVAAVVLVCIHLIPLGVADGGGQYKLVESLGLGYAGAPSGDYFANWYFAYGDTEVRDTHSAVVHMVRTVQNGFATASLLWVYGALLLAGLWAAVRSAMRGDVFDWVAAALCALVFADIGYTAYLNTLYPDSAALVTFVLAAGLLFGCHRSTPPKPFAVLLCAAASLLFAFCGQLQGWLGVILGVLIARLWTVCGKSPRRYVCAVLGAAVSVTSLAFALTYKPVDYEKNIYNAVFFGVAQNDGVESLGLDPGLNELTGTFFSDSVADAYALKTSFFDKISYRKIIGYYLTHPGKYFRQFNTAVRNAYTLRPGYLGNYANGSGKPGQQTGFFALYSTLKSKFVPNTMVFTILLFLIYLGVLLYIYINEREKRPLVEALIGIVVCAGASLKIPVALTGGFEIGRALFTFNMLFDSMLILAVVAGGRYAVARRAALRERFGTTQ